MEILSYLKSHGYKGEILHGDADHVAERVLNLFRKDRTLVKLHGAKVGTIGGSSDWLIDSDPDEAWDRRMNGEPFPALKNASPDFAAVSITFNIEDLKKQAEIILER